MSPIYVTEQDEEKSFAHFDMPSGESDQSNSTQGRRSWQVFEVILVGGLLGLGLTLASDDFNDTVIQKIRPFSVAAAERNLR